MRVVHVITRLIIGGAQENTLFNCEDLVRLHGDDVTLVIGPTEGPEGSLVDRATRVGLDVRLVPELCRAIRPWTDWHAYRKLCRLIRELQPDVVHTHSSKAGILGRAAAWNCRVPAVVHTIHGLPFHPYESWLKNRVYVAAERWATRRCHRIISVADAMTRQALAAGVGTPDLFTTIYSGMDVEPFLQAHDGAKVRREFDIPDGSVVIGKVARLFELKGHDDIIDAATRLLPVHPNVCFLFIGGGAWRGRLEQRVQSLNMARHFRFTGLVNPDRIPDFLSAVDLVVHASYREGLARVLPQALLSAKPVVSYDVDGAAEVVLPGRTGFLVAPGDIPGLTKALGQLVGDPDLRRRLGSAGRLLFTDQFRRETMTAAIRTVYQQVLDGRRQALP